MNFALAPWMNVCIKKHPPPSLLKIFFLAEQYDYLIVQKVDGYLYSLDIYQQPVNKRYQHYDHESTVSNINSKSLQIGNICLERGVMQLRKLVHKCG